MTIRKGSRMRLDGLSDRQLAILPEAEHEALGAFAGIFSDDPPGAEVRGDAR